MVVGERCQERDLVIIGGGPGGYSRQGGRCPLSPVRPSEYQ